MVNLNNFKKSSQCATCKTKPCQIGCPLNNDITEFISAIKKERYREAFDILSNTSVLMPICGRVCPHLSQCQGACVMGISHEPVEIGLLETTVGDMALENDWNFEVPKKTKYNVAVVGSGPAGLTCAAFLRKNGIGVTIYEAHDYLGGLLVHGIPEFRLPREIVKKVTDKIVNLGIEVEYQKKLGENMTLTYLKKKHDAVFLGIGANFSNKMDIPGEDIKNVYGVNELLEQNINLDYNDKVVVVSGGGNVAMDISRTAKRNGAKKVVVIYRRSEKEMPADIKEIKAAKKDGVEFLFMTNILKINGKKKVNNIEVIKTKLVKKEGEARLSPINIIGSNYNIDCDYVMMAVGSHAADFVSQLGLNINRGKIAVDLFGRTNDEKIFSGGDVAGAKATVAWAARSGRNAAYGIIDYLNNKRSAKK